jgi:formylglycine-generating enzyme required for sulfatase activity
MASNRFAMLIGVSEYGEGFDALPGSLLDIAELAKVLNDPECGDFQVELLADPEKSEMENNIELFFRKGNPDDLLLFYFSGHGDLGSGWANQKLHLCAKNTFKVNKNLREASAMSTEFLQRQMGFSKAGQIAIILDCCYSGSIAELVKSGEVSIDFSKIEGPEASEWVILTSSRSSEVSYQIPDGLSLYTRYLIEGIEGAADSTDSDWITASSLYEYAVGRFEIQHQGATQPQMKTKARGYDIPVAKAPKPDPKITFRQAVDARFRKIAERDLEFDGEIPLDSLDRIHLEKRRITLGLSTEDAQQIEADVKSPYPIRSHNRKEYRRAVEIAHRNGFPFSSDDRQLLDEIYKDLSLGKDTAERIEKIVAEGLDEKFSNGSVLPIKEDLISNLSRIIEFETVKLHVQPGRLPGLGSKLVTRSTLAETKYFSEVLDHNINLDMIFIQGGNFWMGAGEKEEGSNPDEYPKHEVRVASFCLGKFPVTQQQWYEIAILPKVNHELNPEPTYLKKGGNYPVEQVSCLEAVEFCNRLSNYTKKIYRLPSEAEWEYACRAGTDTPFYFGETIDAKLANYDGTSTYGKGQRGENRKQTTSVDSFLPNAFGLYDMHGNVWEWCLDHWHDNYQGAPGDGSAWYISDADEGHLRLLRGGSWDYDVVFCRSSQRNGSSPRERKNNIGFRVVCIV